MTLSNKDLYLVAAVLEICSRIGGGSRDECLCNNSPLHQELREIIAKQPMLFSVFDSEGNIKEWIGIGRAEISWENLKEFYGDDISDFESWAEELDMEGAFLPE